MKITESKLREMVRRMLRETNNGEWVKRYEEVPFNRDEYINIYSGDRGMYLMITVNDATQMTQSRKVFRNPNELLYMLEDKLGMSKDELDKYSVKKSSKVSESKLLEMVRGMLKEETYDFERDKEKLLDGALKTDAGKLFIDMSNKLEYELIYLPTEDDMRWESDNTLIISRDVGKKHPHEVSIIWGGDEYGYMIEYYISGGGGGDDSFDVESLYRAFGFYDEDDYLEFDSEMFMGVGESKLLGMINQEINEIFGASQKEKSSEQNFRSMIKGMMRSIKVDPYGENAKQYDAEGIFRQLEKKFGNNTVPSGESGEFYRKASDALRLEKKR